MVIPAGPACRAQSTPWLASVWRKSGKVAHYNNNNRARSYPVPSTETWWLYVLECQGGVLYTGIAKDVDARFAAHLNGTGAIFTQLNRPLRILAKATLATRGDALRAEYAFKQASRADKLQWCATGLERFIALDRR